VLLTTRSVGVKQWKRKHSKAYRIARPVLAVVVLVLLWKWLFG
jgi:beta-hydroxylase